MYCFERLELSATFFLMLLMRLEFRAKNLFYVANIQGDNSLQFFILSKRFGWICGLVLLYVKLTWNFLPRFESSAQPFLFAIMPTLSVSIVSMHLGSFMYSTFGSHHGQSFKLFYKKNQDLPQARPPPSWNTESVETRRVTRHIIWKLRLTNFVTNFPRLGRPQKDLKMEANSVCRNCAK